TVRRGARTFHVFFSVAFSCFAQNAKISKPNSTTAARLASVQGLVLNEATSRPLRRTEVVLHPNEAGLSRLTQTTDENGAFYFPNVKPGSYSFQAIRDGFLPASSGRMGSYRLPQTFLLQEGQTLRDVIIRLSPWAVLAGKVKFDDGEPAISVLVQLYREYY